MKILLLIILLSCSSFASETDDALKNVKKALIKHPTVKEMADRIETRYIPDELKEYSWVIMIIEIADTKTISYTWKF